MSLSQQQVSDTADLILDYCNGSSGLTKIKLIYELFRVMNPFLSSCPDQYQCSESEKVIDAYFKTGVGLEETIKELDIILGPNHPTGVTTSHPVSVNQQGLDLSKLNKSFQKLCNGLNLNNLISSSAMFKTAVEKVVDSSCIYTARVDGQPGLVTYKLTITDPTNTLIALDHKEMASSYKTEEDIIIMVLRLFFENYHSTTNILKYNISAHKIEPI